jgi:hypothetical protein
MGFVIASSFAGEGCLVSGLPLGWATARARPAAAAEATAALASTDRRDMREVVEASYAEFVDIGFSFKHTRPALRGL